MAAQAINSGAIQPLYHAPWPASLDPNNAPWQVIALEAAALALQIIFYPAYFVYCILQKVVNHVLLPSAYITMIETPIQQQGRRQVVDTIVTTSRQANSQFTAKRCNFMTPDGVQLDGLLVRSQAQNHSLAQHKVVVFCCPNGIPYEAICRDILDGLRGNGMPGQYRSHGSLPSAPPPRPRPSSRTGSSNIHMLNSSSSVVPRSSRSRASNVRTIGDCQADDYEQQAQQGSAQVQSFFSGLSGLFMFGQEALARLNSLPSSHLSSEAQQLRQISPQLSNLFTSAGAVTSALSGASANSQFVQVMRNNCLDPDVSVLFVNYRGVGDSGGKAAIAQLPLDVYSSYKYLIDREGYQPSSIAFYGISMGGLAGPCGAALVQEGYGDFVGLGGISLIAPASLSSAADHLITSQYGKALGFLAGSAVSVLQTDLDGPAAWQRLRGPKLAIHGQRDDLVLPEASLAHAVQAQSQDQARILGRYGHFMMASEDRGFPELRQALGLPPNS